MKQQHYAPPRQLEAALLQAKLDILAWARANP
jgi:hypothetical protein